MATKLWLLFFVFLGAAFAYLENYPWLIFVGFLMVTTKLNEIQENMKK